MSAFAASWTSYWLFPPYAPEHGWFLPDPPVLLSPTDESTRLHMYLTYILLCNQIFQHPWSGRDFPPEPDPESSCRGRYNALQCWQQALNWLQLSVPLHLHRPLLSVLPDEALRQHWEAVRYRSPSDTYEPDPRFRYLPADQWRPDRCPLPRSLRIHHPHRPEAADLLLPADSHQWLPGLRPDSCRSAPSARLTDSPRQKSYWSLWHPKHSALSSPVRQVSVTSLKNYLSPRINVLSLRSFKWYSAYYYILTKIFFQHLSIVFPRKFTPNRQFPPVFSGFAPHAAGFLWKAL